MKKLFSTTILFFTIALMLVFSILTGVQAIELQPVDLSACVKSVNNESAVLVLNNKVNGEVSSRSSRNNHVSTTSSPLVLAYQSVNSLLSANKTVANYYYVYNLSTNKSQINQIRAP